VLYDVACGRSVELDAAPHPRVLEGYLKATAASDAAETAELVREYGLPWEALTSDHLASPAVWSALLDAGALPLGALVRNLGVMTARGVVARGSDGASTVVRRLGDVEAIRSARLHPVAVLNAIVTYAGGARRGGVTWSPVPAVVDALDAAFYASFGTVEPAGKRTLLALDVSGSMTWKAVSGAAFNAMQGATAMAMVTAATEPETVPVAFSHGIVPVDVSPRRRLDDQMAALARIPFGPTDCAAPILWALENQVPADTFLVFTDNETWAGQVHPFQALRTYRERMGIDARMIVVGMTSTGFTIADPSDPGMLDVVGFDTSAPTVMAEFSAGRI
jgi:60 kDa SS-A/Ro ribonucleoprotein